MRGLQMQNLKAELTSGFLELRMAMRCHRECSNVSALGFFILLKANVFKLNCTKESSWRPLQIQFLSAFGDIGPSRLEQRSGLSSSLDNWLALRGCLGAHKMKMPYTFLLNSPNNHCYFAAQTSVLFLWRDLWQLSIVSWIVLESLLQICCSYLLLVWQTLSSSLLASLRSSWLLTTIIIINCLDFQSAWCLVWIVYCCQNYNSFLEKSKSLWLLFTICCYLFHRDFSTCSIQ